MPSILLITTSPRGDLSLSSKVATGLVDGLKQQRPESTVVTRDLVATPMPHITPDFATGMFTPADERTDGQTSAIGLSDAAIDELLAAETIVIATGFINFTIPSSLKAWIDHVTRARRTFSYDENGFKGLVANKKVYLVVAYGGVYSDGPMQAMDFCEPYLRSILAFMGMSEIETIRIEGVHRGGEATDKAVANAQAQARALTMAV